MKRCLLFLVSLLICISALSCSKKQTEAPSDNTSDKVTAVIVDTDSMKKKAVEALNSIPSVDLSGSFTVASTPGTVYAPQNVDSNYKVVLEERNAMFEKKYSADLIGFEEDVDTLLHNAHVNHLSGLHYADLISIPQSQVGSFAARGVILKTHTVIGADFGKEWYDSDMMAQAAYGSESYGIYGEFNRDIGSYYCVYVNRDLLTSAGLSMPYDKVRDGSWTWDELIEMIRASADVNGSAGMSVPNMRLLTSAVYKSGGYSYTDTGKGKTPTPSFNNEATNGVVSLLRRIGGHKTLYNDSVESGSARNEFMQGKALFYIGTVSEMKTVTTMSNDWCILPLPKTVATADTYYSYVSPDHAVITVYAGSQCSDVASALDGLYAASSGGYLADAYYYELIDTSIRDSSALDMMDYICGLKGGKPINDLTDLYPEYRANTVDAISKMIYNYDLTLDAVTKG